MEDVNVQTWNDESAEFASVVRTICTTYNLKQDDLCRFTYISVYSIKKHLRKVRRLPVSVPLPQPLHFIAKGVLQDRLIITTEPNPNYENPNEYGLWEMKLIVGDLSVRVWRWRGFREYGPLGDTCHFVEKKDLSKFYRAAITLRRRKNVEVTQPILPGKMIQRIYDNSIGFLLNWRQRSEEYIEQRIAYKRGILLSGKPGSGKTMTCRWLRELCALNRFTYKIVTVETFRQAMAEGSTASLFRVHGRGIIFFDDMDVMVRDRKNEQQELYSFLTHMDGIDSNEGVVYVFTTNEVENLDKAFLRPGRIDLFLIFDNPNEKLRRRFVSSMFSQKLLEKISVEEFVECCQSKDLSFAEMEEVRKMLARDFIEGRPVEVSKTFDEFIKHRQTYLAATEFGFNQGGKDTYDDYYDDDDSEIIIAPKR